jgi:hypothetical protein
MHDQVVLYFSAELSHIADAMLAKMAFVAKTPTMRAKVQAEKHFESADPNWNRFEKNLKLKTFQKVVAGDPRADDKLKKYVDNFGGYLTSKKITAKIVSPDSGKPYVIKEIPGGRLACNCGNWQYRKSVDGGDCKHIEAIVMKKLSFAEKVKAAYVQSLVSVAGGMANLGVNKVRADKAKSRADLSREATRQLSRARSRD